MLKFLLCVFLLWFSCEAPLQPSRPLLTLPNTPEGFVLLEGAIYAPEGTIAVDTDGSSHREAAGLILFEQETAIDFIYNTHLLWVLDF